VGLPAGALSIFGLHLTPRDVDGDHKLDIVATVGFARQPVAVWINDGQGRFQQGDLAAYPSLTPLEDLSFCSPSSLATTQAACDQGPRSRFGLLFGRGPLRAALRPGSQPLQQRELLVSRVPLGQVPVRAPPSSL
jgi:hypothetical protein